VAFKQQIIYLLTRSAVPLALLRGLWTSRFRLTGICLNTLIHRLIKRPFKSSGDVRIRTGCGRSVFVSRHAPHFTVSRSAAEGDTNGCAGIRTKKRTKRRTKIDLRTVALVGRHADNKNPSCPLVLTAAVSAVVKRWTDRECCLL